MGEEVRARRDRLRGESLRLPRRRLLRSDDGCEVHAGLHGVDDDRPAVVVGGDLERAAVAAAVHGEHAVVGREEDRHGLLLGQERLPQRILGGAQQRDLERDRDDLRGVAARLELRVARLAQLLPPRHALVRREVLRLRRQTDEDTLSAAHLGARDEPLESLVKDRAVRELRDDRAGRGEDRVVDAVRRHVHADRRGHRWQSRGAHLGWTDARHDEHDDDEAGDEPYASHVVLRYTSGLSTPMNGRLRYRSA